MFKTYFTPLQISLFLSGFAFFLLSLYFTLKDKEKYSFLFVIISALFIYCFAASLDAYLNLWDERFHALVAKNMMQHPFLPTLYDNPIVQMDYDRWDRAYIWLHKQPLFLWQISLSFTLFGISEFTLRLPSVALAATLVIIAYRSGKLLVSFRTGYFAAILMLSNFYILQLVSGRQSLDHNDISFLAYVSLSIWSLIEYHYSKKRYWIILIGIFSGFAILCKWLPGLLVYAGWFALKILLKQFRFRDWKDVLTGLGITMLIALPWHIFTFIRYPVEALEAFRYNSLHFTHVLEGHGGNMWFYFKEFNTLYGYAAILFILPAFWAFYKKINDKKLFVPLMIIVGFVYLFFSLAGTKMISFPLMIAMIIFISFASLLDFIVDYIEMLSIPSLIKKSIVFTGITVLVILQFNIDGLQATHTLWKKDNWYSRALHQKKEFYQNIKLPGNSVIFNVQGPHYIEAMFYSGLPCYNFIPTQSQYKDMKRKKVHVVVLTDPDTVLPAYVLEDEEAQVIPRPQ